MYTAQKLRDMADEAEKEYNGVEGGGEIGRNMYNMMHSARICADHMDRNNIAEIFSIGPFTTELIVKGDMVRIKKGAVVRSTHPQFPREGKVATKSHTVKVHRVDNGWTEGRQNHSPRITNSEVHWAGTAGYWKWVDINDVEKVKG